jgi:purine-binding chemotaxis protein CheW
MTEKRKKEKASSRPEKNTDGKKIKIALREEELYGEPEHKEEEARYVVMSVSGEWYAVAVEKTTRIISYPRLTYLPCAPDYIIGIINLRGSILSVTDLKKILGLSPSPPTPASRIIVVESEGLRTGILGDRIYDIVSIGRSKIEPSPVTIEKGRTVFLDGSFRTGEKFVGIINVDSIFNIRPV